MGASPRSAGIAPPRFAIRRWRGYDAGQVDRYLKRLGEHIGRLEARVVQLEKTEQAAVDVLHQAQRVAAETVAAAETHAGQLRRNAEQGLENARKDAFAVLGAAQAEADRTLLSARERADEELERSRSETAELRAAGEAQAHGLEQIVDEMRGSVVRSAAELRTVGERLVELAEHLEFKLATGRALIDAPAQGIIDFGNATPQLT